MENDTEEIMGKTYRRVECAGKGHKGVKFIASEINRGGVPECFCGFSMEKSETGGDR